MRRRPPRPCAGDLPRTPRDPARTCWRGGGHGHGRTRPSPATTSPARPARPRSSTPTRRYSQAPGVLSFVGLRARRRAAASPCSSCSTSPRTRSGAARPPPRSSRPSARGGPAPPRDPAARRPARPDRHGRAGVPRAEPLARPPATEPDGREDAGSRRGKTLRHALARLGPLGDVRDVGARTRRQAGPRRGGPARARSDGPARLSGPRRGPGRDHREAIEAIAPTRPTRGRSRRRTPVNGDAGPGSLQALTAAHVRGPRRRLAQGRARAIASWPCPGSSTTAALHPRTPRAGAPAVVAEAPRGRPATAQVVG